MSEYSGGVYGRFERLCVLLCAYLVKLKPERNETLVFLIKYTTHLGGLPV